MLAAGPGGAARLGLLPTAGRRGRAAGGSRCRVAMETLPHPDCSWQRGPAARQALGGDPRERARQAAHGAARPPGRESSSPAPRHPSLPLPGAHTCTCAPQLQQPRRNCSRSPPCSPHSLIQQTFADRLSARRELATAAAATSHTGTPRRPRLHLTARGGGRHRNTAINTVTPTAATVDCVLNPSRARVEQGFFGFCFFVFFVTLEKPPHTHTHAHTEIVV